MLAIFQKGCETAAANDFSMGAERIWTLPPESARPRAQQAPAHRVRTIVSTLIRLRMLLRPGTGALRPRRSLWRQCRDAPGAEPNPIPFCRPSGAYGRLVGREPSPAGRDWAILGSPCGTSEDG